MKLSCLPVSFFPEFREKRIDIPRWMDLGAEIGLDGIDISSMFLENHTPVYLNQLKTAMQSRQIAVVMMATYPDFSAPDSVQRERELDYLRRDIAVASFLGIRYVRIVAGQRHPDTSLELGKRWVIESFKRAAEAADRYGVQLVYENHSKPGAWQHWTSASRRRCSSTSLRRSGHQHSGGISNTANPLVYGDDPLSLLRRSSNLVETVHAADTAVRGSLQPVLLGRGIVPFDKIFAFLKQHGFDGWICMEEASNSGRSGVERAAELRARRLGTGADLPSGREAATLCVGVVRGR